MNKMISCLKWNEEGSQRGDRDTIYEESKNVIRGVNCFLQWRKKSYSCLLLCWRAQKSNIQLWPTSNFLDADDFHFYKDSLEDHLFSIKKYGKRSWAILGEMIKDIDIRSQMSVHQNVLKLLGTQNPIQVYEFVRDIIISKCICIPSTKGLNSEPYPLKCKLRIAMGIANVVAYLYTAFSGLLSIHIYSAG